VQLIEVETSEVVDSAMTDFHGVYHFAWPTAFAPVSTRALGATPRRQYRHSSSRVVSITRGDQFIFDAT